MLCVAYCNLFCIPLLAVGLTSSVLVFFWGWGGGVRLGEVFVCFLHFRLFLLPVLGDVRGVHKGITPLTAGQVIPRNGQDYWYSSDSR